MIISATIITNSNSNIIRVVIIIELIILMMMIRRNDADVVSTSSVGSIWKEAAKLVVIKKIGVIVVIALKVREVHEATM